MCIIIDSFNLQLSEPICAIGHGVAGLCSAKREDGKSWSFKSFSMTGVTDSKSLSIPIFYSL